MATAETARLIASLELQDKNFTRGLKAAEKRLGHIDKRLGAFSGAVNRNVARGIDTLITKGIDAGGAVIQAAIDQESAIVGIRKTVDRNVDQIVEDLKKMSTETGSTFEELASIAETGGAMGIKPEDIAAFTKQVAILGATTNVTIEDAATAIGQMGTVMGITGDEFDNLAASLVDLGNKGNSTEAQILEIAKRSGAAAKTVGVAKDEFLAWASAAANLGLGEELAGTALQKFFVDTQKILARGGDDLKTMGKVAGMTGEQFKKAFKKDATGALHSFIDGLKDLNAEQRVLAIEDLFGKGSGMTRLLLGLSEALDDPTSGLTASLETNAEAWREGTAAQEEADKRFKSSEFAFKRLNNAVNLAAATIGTELLPVLVDLAEEGIDWLMKPATQKGIKSFAVGLGKGIRSLAAVITSINWGSIVGFLSKAAGFAGELVGWFNKMPDWAQAFLVGGFVATRLPVIGGLISELGKGLIKGVLGMTAGVVNINAGVVNGGGVPGVPGGKGGKGPLGLGLKGVGGLLVGATGVGIAALLASEFEDEIQGVAEDIGNGWREWLRTNVKIDIPTISPKDIEWPFGPKNTPTILPEIFGGNGLLGGTPAKPTRPVPSASKPPPGIGGLGAPETGGKRLLTGLGNLTSSVDHLEATLSKPKPTPKDAGGAPGAFRPIVKAVSEQRTELNNMSNALVTLKGTSAEQKTELSNIKNASATLNTSITTQTSAQTAELANIKNASATLNTTTYAGLLASTAATTAGNLLSVFQSASQVLAANSTTTAANNTTTAARNAGINTANAMTNAANRIVTAVNGLDLSVNVTTVNRTSTVNNRYGPSGGSSTTERAGGNTG